MKTTASPDPSAVRTTRHFRHVIGIAASCVAISLVATAVAQPNAEQVPPAPQNSLAPSLASTPAPTPTDGVAVSVNVGSGQSSPDRKCTEAVYEFWGKLAWPITVLILGGALIVNQKWLKMLFGSLRKVKAGQVEFEFNAEDALRAKISISEAYEEFRKTAQVAYAHFVRVYSIKERFEKALGTVR